MILKSNRTGGVTSVLRLSTGNGHGSTNTMIRRYTTIETNTGADFTYTDSATNGMSVTIDRKGIYFMFTIDSRSGGTSFIGLSVNSTQLTTSIVNITAANRFAVTTVQTATTSNQCSWEGELNYGDVVRVHTDSTPNSVSAASSVFYIIRLGD